MFPYSTKLQKVFPSSATLAEEAMIFDIPGPPKTGTVLGSLLSHLRGVPPKVTFGSFLSYFENFRGSGACSKSPLST